MSILQLSFKLQNICARPLEQMFLVATSIDAFAVVNCFRLLYRDGRLTKFFELLVKIRQSLWLRTLKA